MSVAPAASPIHSRPMLVDLDKIGNDKCKLSFGLSMVWSVCLLWGFGDSWDLPGPFWIDFGPTLRSQTNVKNRNTISVSYFAFGEFLADTHPLLKMYL